MINSTNISTKLLSYLFNYPKTVEREVSLPHFTAKETTPEKKPFTKYIQLASAEQ